ncbi:hypothetical protein B0H12DRAFT_1219225 [Mycena haematopus]|nr:hypothetical protein B0H12DRAFT_1219225 [Mycena haematopus]
MHISSTITKTQGDIPVVLITLDGNRKFLPRPETYEEMDRLVREHYQVDSRTRLQFEVSSWDVCAGQSAEVTEAAYPLLVPLLDSVSAVVVQGVRHRAMPSPSATPPLPAEDEIEDEQTVQDHLAESHHGRGTESPARRAPNVESEDEEVFVGSMYGDDEVDRLDRENEDDGDEEEEEEEEDELEEDAPHARQVLNKEFPSGSKQAKRKVVQDDEEQEDVPPMRQVPSKALPAERKPGKGKVVQEEDEVPSPRPVKQEPLEEKPQVKAKAAPKPHAESSKAPTPKAPKSRGLANRSADTAESSHGASGIDERFKVHIKGPRPGDKAEFMTRGGHIVGKVLAGACKTFNLDIDHAKLMLCMPMVEDGEIQMVHFECDRDETVARSGISPNSKLIVRVEYEDAEED